ncbi:hypothetical protein [Clostridium butyricum]|uniref:hypothetical protein n=1 Tax=Clostridium butyricum TaxID=1492 RepID=UPI00189CAC52|nr:hypothetical protein [Clostridium butyricum]MDB2151177.1 hypothetical protein [Clostridium butyricum]MDU3584085.1 hypothetical protein [Clostridium butyricum]MDU3595617.1 hypothetical protein [Clostridium butyricum]
MTNWENFCKMVDGLFKTNSAYENEIGIFKKYLQTEKLQDNVFNLNTTDIDNYFEYCFNNAKIGSGSTLTAHFSALKTLFNYLENKKMNFKTLNGYINTSGVKEKLTEQFKESLKTSIIDNKLLEKILYSFDEYIDSNITKNITGINPKKRFLNVLVGRIFIKISLIIPLKVNEVINLPLYNMKDKKNRNIKHNEIIVKLPNSVRIQIIQTINYIEKNCNIMYDNNEKLFEFLFKALDVKFDTSTISGILIKAYDELNIEEMMKRKESGVKTRSVYTSESYKTTSILNMLKNGTDILALKQLTGLDFLALIKNYDLDEKIMNEDIKSTEINNGITNTNYYVYL